MFMPSAVTAASQEDYYTITAGISGSSIGWNRSDGTGELRPDITYQGYTLDQVVTVSAAGVFQMQLTAAPNQDSVFIDLELTGIFSTGLGTLKVERRDASYTPGGGFTWTGITQFMISGNEYELRKTA